MNIDASTALIAITPTFDGQHCGWYDCSHILPSPTADIVIKEGGKEEQATRAIFVGSSSSGHISLSVLSRAISQMGYIELSY